MSVGDTTVRTAAVNLGAWFLKALVWVVCMHVVAYLLDLEWSWKIFWICIASSFVDAMMRFDK